MTWVPDRDHDGHGLVDWARYARTAAQAIGSHPSVLRVDRRNAPSAAR